MSKLKIAYIVFGQWTNMLMLIGMGVVNLTGAVPQAWCEPLTKWAFILYIVNTGIMTNLQGLGLGLPNVPMPNVGDIMKKSVPLIAVAMLVGSVLMPRAFAADIAVKAPSDPWAAAFKGYPYGRSGIFFGVFTEGGGGEVAGNIPGVGSASLTTTTAGVGGTIGYAWGRPNSPLAFSLEGDFAWTNFNGSTPGMSLSGPLAFEQRFVVFAPLASMLSWLPNGINLGTVAPFAPLPAGITANNLQMGIFAGIRETDISANFAGVGALKEFRVSPEIGLMSMEQLSNHTAVRAWVKTVFPDKSICIGPVRNSCANEGQQVLAGVGVYF